MANTIEITKGQSAKDYIQENVTGKGLNYVAPSSVGVSASSLEDGKDVQSIVTSFVSQEPFKSKAMEDKFEANPLLAFQHMQKRVVYAVTNEGYRFRFAGDNLCIGDTVNLKVTPIKDAEGNATGQKYFAFVGIEPDSTENAFKDESETSKTDEEKAKDEALGEQPKKKEKLIYTEIKQVQ